MADIDVVKKRTSVWPWIIGIIVLALIVWWIAAAMTGSSTGTGTAPVSLLHAPEVSAIYALV